VAKFRDYFEYDEAICSVPSHRALAVFRGRTLGLLDVRLALATEPEPGQPSLAEGRIVHIDTPKTIADGAQTQHSGALTFPVIQALVKGIVTASDEQLVQAMRFFAERMKIVVEPTGCLGAAALMSRVAGLPDLRGRRVGVILSGGNVDVRRYAELLAG